MGCIYCGGALSDVRKGDHLIPEALGSDPTVPIFCTACNSGELSRIDRHLTSESHISLIKYPELARSLNSGVWNTPGTGSNLLVDARIRPGEAPANYPQLIVDGEATSIFYDPQELGAIPWERFEGAFRQYLGEAFQAHRRGSGGLHFRIVEREPVSEQLFRHPPRLVATQETADTIVNRRGHPANLQVRMLNESDRDVVLTWLANMYPAKKFRGHAEHRLLDRSLVQVHRKPDVFARAIAKIGINILAKYEDGVSIRDSGFRPTLEAIRGTASIPRPMEYRSGPVRPAALNGLHLEGSHVVRLQQTGNGWCIYVSFFGGRACAVGWFPGPRMRWTFGGFQAPYPKKPWSDLRTAIEVPLIRCRIEWDDVPGILPSLGLVEAERPADA